LFKKIDQILRLFNSNKPLIIYKTSIGFDIFTDFSEKIKLNHSNLNDFFTKIERQKNKTDKYFDGYIGFFGYEILCNLIGVRIPKQKTNNFSKGIFYKPESIIKIRDKIQIKNLIKNYDCPSHPHNIYLQWMIETGIFGLIFFLVYLYFIINYIFINNFNNYSLISLSTLLILFWPIMSTGSLLKNWNGVSTFFIIGICLALSNIKQKN